MFVNPRFLNMIKIKFSTKYYYWLIKTNFGFFHLFLTNFLKVQNKQKHQFSYFPYSNTKLHLALKSRIKSKFVGLKKGERLAWRRLDWGMVSFVRFLFYINSKQNSDGNVSDRISIKTLSYAVLCYAKTYIFGSTVGGRPEDQSVCSVLLCSSHISLKYSKFLSQQTNLFKELIVLRDKLSIV